VTCLDVRELLPELAVGVLSPEDREQVERFPRHAALKAVLAARGVPLREDVRPPLRTLTEDERGELESLLDGWLGTVEAA